MGAERHESKPNLNRNTTKLNQQVTTQLKTEIAQVRMTLLADDRARYMREGQCFSCGKTGHCRPECPDGRSRAHVVAIEPTASDPTLNPIESKN